MVPPPPVLASRLPRPFYARDTIAVARDLLGCFVVSASAEGLTAGRIVETEAYLGPDDPASHAARLRQGRVEAMHGSPGIAYVYCSYGIHAMLNVVAKPGGEVGAVLIRALEPVAGINLMRARRGAVPDRLLCAGPGRLCQALGIGLDLHGLDLVARERLWIASGESVLDGAVAVGSRIGISRGQEHPWRFWERGSAYVSAHRRESGSATESAVVWDSARITGADAESTPSRRWRAEAERRPGHARG